MTAGTRVLCAIAAAICLAAGGCGRAETPAVEEQTPQAAHHAIGRTTIRTVDPEGRWTLEIRAERVEAEGARGPYTLEPAEVQYEEAGRPPVAMRSERARLDEEAERLLLEGEVEVSTEAWSLAADRVEYDLDSGEVVAAGQTKWTFTEVGDGEDSATGGEP